MVALWDATNASNPHFGGCGGTLIAYYYSLLLFMAYYTLEVVEALLLPLVGLSLRLIAFGEYTIIPFNL